MAAIAVIAAGSALFVWALRERSRSGAKDFAAPPAASERPPLPIPVEARPLIEERERRDRGLAREPLTIEAQRARIEASPHFTEQEKAKLQAQLDETQRVVDEARATARADAAEIERDLARVAAEKAALPVPEARHLRLEVDRADETSLLPGRPVIVNLRLVNAGDKEVRVDFVLAPELGRLKAEVRLPGTEDYWPRRLSVISGMQVKERTLAPGAVETWQTDLFLDLREPGEYAVRLSLPAKADEEPATAEFTVRVAAAHGPDAAVLDRIRAANLWGFLGTKALGLGGMSFAKEDVRKAVAEAEALSRQFPDSVYAADLRIGCALGMESFRNVLATSTDAIIDLNARLQRLWLEIGRRDRPKTWARAELLPLLAVRAQAYPELGTPDENKSHFRRLCPNDPRAR